MNEEELFCKQFPEYVVNGKPLSPYFDLFESGYEQAEKRIEELEDKLIEKDIQIKELQEQKVYWKESSFDWRHKFFKLDKVKRLIKKDKQLTKAKEIIKKLKALYFSPVVTKDDVKRQDEILNEAEQFLKGE